MSNEPEQVQKTDQEVQEALRQEEVARERGEMPGSPKEESTDSQVMAVDTAFVVFVQDGAAFATAGLPEPVTVRVKDQDLVLEPLRRADPQDMYRYSMEVAKDIQVSETSAATVQQMAAYTQQLQRQLQKEQQGGIQVPGR